MIFPIPASIRPPISLGVSGSPQDVFIELFAAIKRFDLERPFLPWLHKIAVRRSLDKIRRRKDHDTIDVIIDRLSPDLSPEEEVEKSAQRAAMWAAVGRLDDKHRAVVVLYYYLDFSVAEIAGILGRPGGTVRRRLYYARARLRELLPPPEPGLDDPGFDPSPAPMPPNPKFPRRGKEQTQDLV